jgi:hypothetical protein
MDKQTGERLIALRERIVSGQFDAGNWEELGLLTGRSTLIHGHDRLLRSLSWGDPDYPGNVLIVLRMIVEKDTAALEVIEDYLDKTLQGDSTYVSAKHAERRITFAPHVFKVPGGGVDDSLVAVMMPLAREFDGVYRAIKEAATDCVYNCLRADDIWENATVIQDIFGLIFRAKIVVVDFTGKNPNVMYETGIAHTLGKHVIPITQSLEDVPFDMRHHRVLKYLANAEGLKKLESDLSAKLGQTNTPGYWDKA